MLHACGGDTAAGAGAGASATGTNMLAAFVAAAALVQCHPRLVVPRCVVIIDRQLELRNALLDQIAQQRATQAVILLLSAVRSW